MGDSSEASFDGGKWLRLDEIENACDNLQMCSEFLERTEKPIRWKWAVIALHQALYGFAICAVQGRDFASVLENPTNPGKSRLIDIWTALERTKSPEHLWFGASPVSTTPEEDEAIHRLIREFRNGFEHFQPALWSIEVSGMPTIFLRVLRVVGFIALESRSVRYQSDSQELSVRKAVTRLERILAAERSSAS